MRKRTRNELKQLLLPGVTPLKKGDRVRRHPGPGRYLIDFLSSDPYIGEDGQMYVDTVQQYRVPMRLITTHIPKVVHEKDHVP